MQRSGAPFSIRTEGDLAGTTRVRVSGELDLATRDQLERCIGSALDSRQRIVLDLTDVSFIDSTGLAAIIAAAQRAAEHGVQLQLASPLRAQPHRLMELTGMLAQVEFAPARDGASPSA